MSASIFLPLPCYVISSRLSGIKADTAGRLVARIAGSNPAEGMGVCLLCLYVVLSCVYIYFFLILQGLRHCFPFFSGFHSHADVLANI
jgi:hypothetical protein